MPAINFGFIAKVNTFKERFPCSTVCLDRTPLHNASIGGAKLSWHLNTLPEGCQAIDLIFDEPEDLLPAAKYAKELGFGGIELDFRNLHLHLDARPTIWHVVCTKKKTLSLDEYLTRIPEPV